MKLPMQNPEQYQVNLFRDNEDNNNNVMMSDSMQTRMAFEAVEEPLKLIVKSSPNIFGMTAISNIGIDTEATMEGMKHFSNLSTKAQVFGRNISQQAFKRCDGVWAKALEIAARMGK